MVSLWLPHAKCASDQMLDEIAFNGRNKKQRGRSKFVGRSLLLSGVISHHVPVSDYHLLASPARSSAIKIFFRY